MFEWNWMFFYKKGIVANGFTYWSEMTCRCLLGHLLITFACSSKPARRGEAVCAVQVRVAWDILGKQDWLFLDQAFRLRSKYLSRMLPNINGYNLDQKTKGFSVTNLCEDQGVFILQKIRVLWSANREKDWETLF